MVGGGNVQCRVYVHNLPYRFSWQDLKDTFVEAGTVVRADIMMSGQRRSKGCGIVEFATPEDAQNAIATMNDAEVDGRKILVREDRENGQPRDRQQNQPPRDRQQNRNNTITPAHAAASAEGRQVFVNNLDRSITWQELKDAFSPAGKVVRADIIGDDQGLSKGQGLILFETADAAAKAIADYHEGELKDKVISVKMDTKVGQFGRLEPQGGNANPNPNPKPKAPKAQRFPQVDAFGNPVVHPVSKRVYVHNLPYSVTWQDLKDHFRPAGEVVYADIMRNNGGRSKGCGIVEFATVEEAGEAIQTMNETEFAGRAILVREDREANNNRGNNNNRNSAPAGDVAMNDDA